MKKLLFILSIVAVGFSSCKKEGPQGEKGDQGVAGTGGKTYNYTLFINAGDTYKEYNGITNFDSGDMVINYVLNANYGSDYYVQTPYIYNGVNIWTEVSEDNGDLYVNFSNADGSAGSPVQNSANVKFKAVHIKSSYIQSNPNVDLSNYKEVVEAFNIVE
jgi:hypothetical protein